MRSVASDQWSVASKRLVSRLWKLGAAKPKAMGTNLAGVLEEMQLLQVLKRFTAKGGV